MVTKTRLEDTDSVRARRRLEQLAVLLDRQWRVPGTNLRFGLDALIGLIPGVGDVAGLALGLWLLGEAKRMGIGRFQRGRMVVNLLIDTVVGAIPLVGDVFDVGFRANTKNLRLMGIVPPPRPSS
jgi:hypothetical protein